MDTPTLPGQDALASRLSSIRHDLRNSLGLVRGFSELVAETLRDIRLDDGHRAMEIICTEASDLTNLITLSLVPTHYSDDTARAILAKILHFCETAHHNCTFVLTTCRNHQLATEIEDIAKIRESLTTLEKSAKARLL